MFMGITWRWKWFCFAFHFFFGCKERPSERNEINLYSFEGTNEKKILQQLNGKYLAIYVGKIYCHLCRVCVCVCRCEFCDNFCEGGKLFIVVNCAADFPLTLAFSFNIYFLMIDSSRITKRTTINLWLVVINGVYITCDKTNYRNFFPTLPTCHCRRRRCIPVRIERCFLYRNSPLGRGWVFSYENSTSTRLESQRRVQESEREWSQ